MTIVYLRPWAFEHEETSPIRLTDHSNIDDAFDALSLREEDITEDISLPLGFRVRDVEESDESDELFRVTITP